MFTIGMRITENKKEILLSSEKMEHEIKNILGLQYEIGHTPWRLAIHYKILSTRRQIKIFTSTFIPDVTKRLIVSEIGLRADKNVNVRKSKLCYKKGVADCERLF